MRLSLLRLIQRLRLKSGRSWAEVIRAVRRFISQLLKNPQVAELWRFIFLGTVVETGRLAGGKLADMVSSFFVVKATFRSDEDSYHWARHYLESHHIWDQSRQFSVVARNKDTKHAARLSKIIASTSAPSKDGHPDPVYEPAPQVPEFFRWRGYWLTVTAPLTQTSNTSSVSERFADLDPETLILSVWSRNRNILDDFVREARDFYLNSPVPPRTVKADRDKSGCLLTAKLNQNDSSYDFTLAYLRSLNVLNEVTEFTVTTKQSDLDWGAGSKDAIRYVPGEEGKQMFQYYSSCVRQKIWVQISMRYGSEDYRGRMVGGEISLTFHTSNRDVLEEFMEEAREEYRKNTISKVTLHLTDNYGQWNSTVTRHRRSLNTLVLPDNIKETLLADIQEFLDSEEWYTLAGVPHRRGYLLYGDPGCGKSSTIHAMAGELGLEIYCISLASPGIDDHTLVRLLSDTPSRCILLLEDIDCAFPSREDTIDLEETEFDESGNPTMMRTVPPKSEVTLSGLLNVLDSVTSEEGRVTFATTNHIDSLDPALIRPGRMDVKIHYTLATKHQAEQVFKRFYPADHYVRPAEPEPEPTAEMSAAMRRKLARPFVSAEELDKLAVRFAEIAPANTYSVAQLQGYLLNKKWDPLGAVEGLAGWFQAMEDEKALVEAARLRKLEAAKRKYVANKKAEESAGPEGEKEKEKVDEAAPVGGEPEVVNGDEATGEQATPA